MRHSRVTEHATHVRPLIRSNSDEKREFVSARLRSTRVAAPRDWCLMRLFDFARRWCAINQQENINAESRGVATAFRRWSNGGSTREDPSTFHLRVERIFGRLLARRIVNRWAVVGNNNMTDIFDLMPFRLRSAWVSVWIALNTYHTLNSDEGVENQVQERALKWKLWRRRVFVCA